MRGSFRPETLKSLNFIVINIKPTWIAHVRIPGRASFQRRFSSSLSKTDCPVLTQAHRPVTVFSMSRYFAVVKAPSSASAVAAGPSLRHAISSLTAPALLAGAELHVGTLPRDGELGLLGGQPHHTLEPATQTSVTTVTVHKQQRLLMVAEEAQCRQASCVGDGRQAPGVARLQHAHARSSVPYPALSRPLSLSPPPPPSPPQSGLVSGVRSNATPQPVPDSLALPTPPSPPALSPPPRVGSEPHHQRQLLRASLSIRFHVRAIVGRMTAYWGEEGGARRGRWRGGWRRSGWSSARRRWSR
jgi:hypothetical protein